ncbi:MAG: exosome complex protein Rrp42 [Candidatus Micrarchaeia archaeon]
MGVFEDIKSNYVKELLAKGMREDERGMFDFRKISIIKDFIPQAEGSSIVNIGDTKVLVGVKMQIGTPMEDNPTEGNLTVSAELLPLAHAEFESGPPSPESIELARVVDRGIRAANSVDLAKLFIEEGKVWEVYCDIYVLNYDGNLFDASTLAVMAALRNTKMPKYENGKAIYEERNTPLPVNDNVVSTTFGKINDKIILDPNIYEENALDARLTIANDGKRVRAMQKGLNGSISDEEIDMMVNTSINKYDELNNAINNAVKEE